MSQKARILNYMKLHGSITTRESVIELGIMCPWKRFEELRRDGERITSTWETGQNRYGEECRFKRYYLVTEPRGMTGSE